MIVDLGPKPFLGRNNPATFTPSRSQKSLCACKVDYRQLTALQIFFHLIFLCKANRNSTSFSIVSTRSYFEVSVLPTSENVLKEEKVSHLKASMWASVWLNKNA